MTRIESGDCANAARDAGGSIRTKAAYAQKVDQSLVLPQVLSLVLRLALPLEITSATVANATTNQALAPWTRPHVRRLAGSLVLLQAQDRAPPPATISATAAPATTSLAMVLWTRLPVRRPATRLDIFSTSE